MGIGIFGTDIAYANEYFGNDKGISELKEILYELNRGSAIQYDSEIYSVIESAIDELEYYRDKDFDIDEVVESAWDKGEDVVNELISKLRDTRRYYKNSQQKTIDDLTDQIIEWYDMSVKELRAESDYQGLATSGTKKEIIVRLKEKFLQENRITV